MTGTVVFKFITPLHSLIISTAPSLITYHSINAMNATTFMDMNASVPAGTFINEHTPVNDNARMLMREWV